MKSIEPPSPLLLMLEGRAVLETCLLPYSMPLLRQSPEGDGHSVLVLPGFLASSTSTAPLRWFLKDRGYVPHRWRLGRNTGYNSELGDSMNARLTELFNRTGQKVSLVGWSLGGVYAREIAREQPDKVRQVVTLGSPFRGGGSGNNVSGLYEWINGRRPDQASLELLERMETPPPVPCTAVYSRSDGVVSWKTTVERLEHERVENVEVCGAHCGLGVNAAALAVVADRLAQPDGAWQPFRPTGLQRFLYRKIESQHFAGDPRERSFRTRKATNPNGTVAT